MERLREMDSLSGLNFLSDSVELPRLGDLYHLRSPTASSLYDLQSFRSAFGTAQSFAMRQTIFIYVW